MTPEFQREIGIPRVTAIEYPYGRPVGQVNDVKVQRRVLRETLSFLEKAANPGETYHLPFTWPEKPKHTKWQLPEISPVVKLFLGEIKKAGAAAKNS